MRLFCITWLVFGCAAKSDDVSGDSGNSVDSGSVSTDSGEVTAPLLPDGFEDDLTKTQACTDTFFGAANPDDTVALTVTWYGLLQAAIDEGPQDQTVAIEDEIATVELRIGESVSVNWCTDALEVVPDPMLLRGVSGELRVQASTRASHVEDGGNGSVTLTELHLMSDTGDSLHIDQIEIGPLDIIGAWGG